MYKGITNVVDRTHPATYYNTVQGRNKATVSIPLLVGINRTSRKRKKTSSQKDVCLRQTSVTAAYNIKIHDMLNVVSGVLHAIYYSKYNSALEPGVQISVSSFRILKRYKLSRAPVITRARPTRRLL